MVLLLLATVAAATAAYLSSSAASFAIYDDRLRAQALMHAGIELTAYDLLSVAKGDRKTRGSVSFRLDKGSVAVDYVMEDSRLDLNFTSKSVMAKLFEVLGASSDAAADYAARVIGWRSPLSGPARDREAAVYREAGLSYGPKGSSFASEDELWLLPGLPSDLVEKALQFVTVFSGRREIDVFGAAPEVIAALPGVEPKQAASFVARRESMPHAPTAVIDLLGSAEGLIAVYSRDNVRLNCSVALDNGWRSSAEIVIQLQGGGEPYVVLSWNDAERSAR